jgi:hypothetical protein
MHEESRVKIREERRGEEKREQKKERRKKVLGWNWYPRA